jgi:hypothetical protein
MHSRRPLIVLAVVAALLALPIYTAVGGARDPSPPDDFRVLAQTALDDAFTYQGRLTESNAPANGAYDFQFTIFGAATGSAQVCTTAANDVTQKDNVQVTGGMFTTSLEFCPEAFDGEARWLEIAIRPGASTGTYTVLSPRQEITPTPYALFAKRVGGLQVPFIATGTTTGTTALVALAQTGTVPATVFGLTVEALTGTGAKLSGDAAALELDGPLKVSGTKTAFNVIGDNAGEGENTCDADDAGLADDGIELPNTVANANTDLVLITLVAAGGATLQGPFAVTFDTSAAVDCTDNRWVIHSLTNESLTGATFNVLVIKQ